MYTQHMTYPAMIVAAQALANASAKPRVETVQNDININKREPPRIEYL